jgi:hypothetical protein
MLQEMKFYLDQMKTANGSHRRICNRFSARFSSSPSAIKDALLREGYIELDYVKREGAGQKFNHYFKLTKKKFDPEMFAEKPKEIEVQWEDGTPKSSNNAFDWKATRSNLFSSKELVRAQQKYHNNAQITVYSRA